jgi:hypothetical protein
METAEARLADIVQAPKGDIAAIEIEQAARD